MLGKFDYHNFDKLEITAKTAKEKGFDAEPFGNIKSALQNPDKLTVICGSLYLYKDFKEM